MSRNAPSGLVHSELNTNGFKSRRPHQARARHAQSPFLRTSLTLQQPAGSWTQSYAYDDARRLDTLTSPAGQFAYDYHLAGRKVENLFLPTGGRIANDYATDPLARLTGTWLLNSAQQTLNYHGYEHNLRNDITRHTRTDASFVDYDYDDLGQLTDAVGSGGQSVELLAYGYDTGWNMTGDGTTGYFVNDRNQVTGMTDGTNLGYDAHGNLLGRDNWNQQYGLIYTYDAENRLTRVEEDTYYNPYALRTEFVYDGLSRLRIRREYQQYYGDWYPSGEVRYIYDGRRVIQERSSANTPTVTYTRGNDLSGSLEGAGGIGGMLARSHGYSGSTGNWSTHNYYHADAGGNITCLINSNNGITAIYRYDPFGRTLFQSGTMANANVYRFSSKEVHGFTGMYYYGFRFYDPTLQRWINRDPIGEVGGLNLYGFVGGNPINYVDPDGLTGWQLTPVQRCWELPYPSDPLPPAASPIEAGKRKLGQLNYASYPTQFISSPPRWWFNAQCNRFVGDCITECPTMPPPLIETGGRPRYPSVAEWGDPTVDIPGYGPPHFNPQPGDVVFGDGHMGFMTENGYLNAPTRGPVRILPFGNPRWNPDRGRTPLQ